MLQAMFNGVSAIEANQENMDVIGNNIANVNTTAYKAGSVTFQDQLSQTMQGASAGNSTVGGTDPIQVGLGVKVGAIDVLQQQGGLQSTSKPTDMAIQGNGYFMVGDGSGIGYTRDGSFSLDNNGNLVNADGKHVLGWTANTNGTIPSTQQITQASTLNVPVGSLQATAKTTQVVYSGNLDSDNVGAASPAPYTRSVTVYDSLGDPQSVTLSFSPTTLPTSGAPAGAASKWTWTASGATGVVGTPTGTTNQGSIYFDSNGKELSSAGQVQLTPTDSAATPQNITLDFSKVGQISGSSSASAVSQDGYAPGTLQSFSVDQTGTIAGIFTNGQTRTLGQIALTTFANPGGLQREGSNDFQATVNSGLPQIGAATTGSFGQISTGYLEQSNVDLSSEFTKMIITQNAYSANTKVVSTVDQMLKTLINVVQ